MKKGLNEITTHDDAIGHQDAYVGKFITIYHNSQVCCHSGNSDGNLPHVFNSQKTPWINPDAENYEDIIKVVRMCPSGALTYSFNNEYYD